MRLSKPLIYPGFPLLHIIKLNDFPGCFREAPFFTQTALTQLNSFTLQEEEKQTNWRQLRLFYSNFPPFPVTFI